MSSSTRKGMNRERAKQRAKTIKRAKQVKGDTNPRWHYTWGDRLESIIRDGRIRLATAFVPKSERPVVWCSTNPSITRTAIPARTGTKNGPVHLGQLSIVEAAEACGMLVRIGITPEAAPYDWDAFKRLSHVRQKVAKGLYVPAILQRDDPSEWRCSFRPIEMEDWISLDLWRDGSWVGVSGNLKKGLFVDEMRSIDARAEVNDTSKSMFGGGNK